MGELVFSEEFLERKDRLKKVEAKRIEEIMHHTDEQLQYIEDEKLQERQKLEKELQLKQREAEKSETEKLLDKLNAKNEQVKMLENEVARIQRERDELQDYNSREKDKGRGFRDTFTHLKCRSSHIKNKQFFPDWASSIYNNENLEYNGKDISKDFLVHCIIGSGFYIDERIKELETKIEKLEKK